MFYPIVSSCSTRKCLQYRILTFWTPRNANFFLWSVAGEPLYVVSPGTVPFFAAICAPTGVRRDENGDCPFCRYGDQRLVSAGAERSVTIRTDPPRSVPMGASTCQWVQVRASGCKPVRVGANGCKLEQVHINDKCIIKRVLSTIITLAMSLRVFFPAVRLGRRYSVVNPSQQCIRRPLAGPRRPQKTRSFTTITHQRCIVNNKIGRKWHDLHKYMSGRV